MTTDNPQLNEHNKQEFPPAHTAEHLLNQTMVRMFGCRRSRHAHIERKKSKIGWELPQSPTETEVQQLELRINELIAQALPVSYEFLTIDRLPPEVEVDKLPDDVSQTLRLVRIGNYDVCACIGSHVENTREIGTFKINSWRYQDGLFRIVYKVTPPVVE